MSYALSRQDAGRARREPVLASLRRLVPLMAGEGRNVAIAFLAIIVSSAAALSGPAIIASVVDNYIAHGEFGGVLFWAGVLLGVYLCALVANYVQTRTMGGVGRRILFNLRNTLFNKLQELPVAFFHQNRSGDLISRINNDTDRLNQFFAQALMRFLSNAFLIAGAGIMLVVLNPPLGLAALAPAVGVLIVSQLISGWVKRRSLESLQTLGGLSSEVQERLANFKVIAAFNRLDYFRARLEAANEANFKASLRAGIAGNSFIPLYGLAYNLGQLLVLAYGLWLIGQGTMTTGLLIGYLLYVSNFYNPLRQVATVWSSFQLALAALDRISEVLELKSDMAIVPAAPTASGAVLEFRNVGFRYPVGKDVLGGIDFSLERGRTYALVGPTGGGKTTTASLMARLYDPSEGQVLLEGRDIRSYSPAERADRIAFILQEPFLFTGTVRDNIVYGNCEYEEGKPGRLEAALEESGLSALLGRFEKGLDTEVESGGEAMSLGQKQLIAFMRAALRRPALLILDEATANVDTVTERALTSILDKLPPRTTRVVIAHRLNTIDNADEIFFVNEGAIIRAGSMEHAVAMLMHNRMAS